MYLPNHEANFKINNEDMTDQEFSDFLSKDGVLFIEDGAIYLEESEETLLASYLCIMKSLGYNICVFDSLDEYNEYCSRLNIDLGCEELTPYLISNRAVKRKLTFDEIAAVLNVETIQIKR